MFEVQEVRKSHVTIEKHGMIPTLKSMFDLQPAVVEGLASQDPCFKTSRVLIGLCDQRKNTSDLGDPLTSAPPSDQTVRI